MVGGQDSNTVFEKKVKKRRENGSNLASHRFHVCVHVQYIHSYVSMFVPKNYFKKAKKVIQWNCLHIYIYIHVKYGQLRHLYATLPKYNITPDLRTPHRHFLQYEVVFRRTFD